MSFLRFFKIVLQIDIQFIRTYLVVSPLHLLNVISSIRFSHKLYCISLRSIPIFRISVVITIYCTFIRCYFRCITPYTMMLYSCFINETFPRFYPLKIGWKYFIKFVKYTRRRNIYIPCLFFVINIFRYFIMYILKLRI